MPQTPLHLLLLLTLSLLEATPTIPDRYALHYSPPPPPTANGPQEYIDPTYPTPRPPPGAPSCTVPLLTHSFANTYGRSPATAPYAPPAACPPPWSLVVLAFSAACAGEQYDRVAAVWLDGAELLRTTTAEPTESGVRWSVHKDVTRFAALLRSPPDGVVSVMLENIVNEEFTGVYHVNVSLDFYGAADIVKVRSSDKPPPLPKPYFQAADLIVPVSEASGESGFWFRTQNALDGHSKLVTIPSNTYRAVLEVFVSYHSNDEFWYSNPPDLYIKDNNLTTGRGNAAYREVVVTVDRRFVGSVVPFPVIFTGGINPLFWQPVVALGAFNLPSYDLELTPFLGLLLDGKPHEIGISVVNGISVWLVDANLHLWLDPNSSNVSAQIGHYRRPRLSISRRYSHHLLNGSFEIHGKRKSLFAGWVKSSFGNLTTEIEGKLTLSSLVEFRDDGNNKTVQMKAKQKTELTIRSEKREVIAEQKIKTEYPLWFESLTEPGENGTYTLTTNLSHALHQKVSNRFANGESSASLINEQLAEGWMFVKDHSVLNGSAGTKQGYRYSDDNGFHERMISAKDGMILSDNVTEEHGVSMW